jgi:diguanylate cyclase (GGDEF)-like protein
MSNNQKKIIAVDDNIENLTAIKNSLKDLYEVYTSPSVSKMFDLLEHIMPDLFLLDVEMPEINGYEAAKKLKSDRRYKHIPIMFLTVRDDINSEMEGLRLGAVDYVHKPLVTPLLIQRIQTHLALVDYQKIEIITKATVIAMKHIREGFVLVDTDNNYLSSNPAMIDMFPGFAELEKGKSIFSLKDWPEELKEKYSEDSYFEFSITDENSRYFRADISPVFIEENTLAARIILFTDITDNVNLLKKLEDAAYIDALTGSYNRKHFTELAEVDIQRAIKMNQPVFTAILDIDLFQDINDTYGHAAGDMVLKTAAETIRQTLRPYDLFGRYGSDEFNLLFTVTDETEVYYLTEKVRENIEHSAVNHEGKEIKFTCSIGLAKCLEYEPLKIALHKAGKALTAARSSGRNQVKKYDSLLYEE